MMLVFNDGCDGRCSGGAAPSMPDAALAGAANPPSNANPSNPFELSKEQRIIVRKNKKEAKKYKKKYYRAYCISFGLVIISAIIASVGAELVYAGGGILLFGLLLLFGARISMTMNEAVCNMVAQYIAKMEMALGGVEVFHPKSVVSNPDTKNQPPGFYL